MCTLVKTIADSSCQPTKRVLIEMWTVSSIFWVFLAVLPLSAVQYHTAVTNAIVPQCRPGACKNKGTFKNKVKMYDSSRINYRSIARNLLINSNLIRTKKME